MHLREQTLSSKNIYEGCIFTVTQDIAKLENDALAQRDVIRHPGGVCVIPVTEDNEIYMVKQFRYPFSEITTEVPAGKLEYGEAHYDCGKRELLEETGFNCSEYVFLGELYPTPAYNTEIIYMYLAKGLVQDKQNLDEDEFIDVVKIPLEKAVDMVMNNEIKDGKTKLIILMAARILGI